MANIHIKFFVKIILSRILYQDGGRANIFVTLGFMTIHFE